LQRWTNRVGRDPKRTYIWICSLCLNQHRVQDKAVSPEELAAEFGPRVLAIGRLLPMLEPWCVAVCAVCRGDLRAECACVYGLFSRSLTGPHRTPCRRRRRNPLYLNRAWCLFELYTAIGEREKVEIDVIL
jgi:hypothetical protein